jgi:hypothetical protein
MKPLAFSMYCPNDCDRKVQEEIDPEKTPLMIRFSQTEGTALASSSADPDPLDWSWVDSWIDGLELDTD